MWIGVVEHPTLDRLGASKPMAQSRPLPSQSDLLEHLRYDPETGLLWWVQRGQNRSLAVPAGCKNYRCGGMPAGIKIMLNKRHYQAHRLAWKMMTGEDPGSLTVDHINRNPFDNRFSNLRLADCSLQTRNQCSKGVSAHKGVHFSESRGKWVAMGWLNGKQVFLGRFPTEQEAAAAAAPHYIP